MKTKRNITTRTIALVAVAVATAGVSYAGWRWMDDLVVVRVVVDGLRHADESAILAVARVDSGRRLLDVNPAIIADRAGRHPWVREAVVRRLPPGIVRIEISERAPVALALDVGGRPAAYLDRAGYAMPIVSGAVYDVPLVRGLRLPDNRTQPIAAASVTELLRTLDDVGPILDALVSSFEVRPDGEIVLHTAPAGTQTSITVRLGSTGFSEKFQRLQAFWLQAVLSRPEKTFEVIDLRFDSQIVTTES